MKISKLKYLYTLEHDVIFDTSIDFGELRYLKDDSGKIWASVKGNVLIVERGYSWDGCTPKYKIKLFGRTFIFGISDGGVIRHKRKYFNEWAPLRKYASLKHDVLCQFLDQLRDVMHPDEAHLEFRNDLRKLNDPWANTYYNFVKLYWDYVRKHI